ncbi:MAG TPA: serine/threonine-protein kinase [Kofleriaceae bacterium]|nr:serine/threonine-protein kinase [Kofleriaceae bacterium]
MIGGIAVDQEQAGTNTGANDVERGRHDSYNRTYMVPDDGESAGEAFAATIAPVSTGPGPSPPSAVGTPLPRRHAASEIESGETVAAPVEGAMPPLPIVPAELYKPDKEIARGGMGRIVAAADQRLGRPVALKELIDPHPDQLGRFQREALITARLQHPGIVPVYEAGRWPSGDPFFAMKLVSGRPFDKVIGEARTLEQRLALLPRIAAAADAIAYAHSQRVIHRDLKPGNILIGDFGETVVIDWGLAKDLDVTDPSEPGARSARESRPSVPTATQTNSTLTIAGAVMGTPAYMAPEQARGEPLDARADVFALGAMLYHLLAGVPPYNARTATDVIAAAALGRVVPLVEREQGAPADLVAIVERAMAQDPARRYPHAGELADELRRFLTGQLVTAHRYTAVQRLKRFIRKHRAAVTIASLSLVTFAVLGTLAIRQIVHERDAATRERRIADARRVAAEQLIDTMLSDVKDRLTAIGRLDVMANLGGEIRTYYDTLSAIPGGMPEDDGDRMALAVDIVGIAERESGQLDQALATWTAARDRLVAAVGADRSPRTRLRRRMIARFDFEIGTVHQQRGRAAQAIAAYTAAKKGYDALSAEAPTDRMILMQKADTHDRLGDLLRNEGKIDAAFEEYSAARHEREHLGGRARRLRSRVLALSTSHMKLGSVYLARGESGKALEAFRAALRLRESLLESQPDNVELQERVLDCQDQIALVQRQLGDDKSAIQTYREAVPVLDALARRDPTNATWKRQRGNLLSNLGFALLDTGEFTTGLAQLELAEQLQQELVQRDGKALWQGDLARTLARAADGRMYLGELDKALAQYKQSLAIRERMSADDPRSAPFRRSVAWAHAKLAAAYEVKGDVANTLASHAAALALREALVQESPAHTGFRNELASTQIAYGTALASRDPARAKQLIDAGLGHARALVTGDPINFEWKESLTQALLAQAAVSKLAGDRPARRAALDEAKELAVAAAARAPQNAHWPGYVAEIHAALAELAPDAKAAAAEWKVVRDALEPLAAAKRLPAYRKSLLERARAVR